MLFEKTPNYFRTEWAPLRLCETMHRQKLVLITPDDLVEDAMAFKELGCRASSERMQKSSVIAHCCFVVALAIGE